MALDPLTAGLGLADTIISRIWPDAEASEERDKEREAAKQKVQLAIMEAAMKGDLGQLAVNEAEAKHENLFVSGWRPFVGWVCALSLAFNFVVLPLLAWAAVLAELPALPDPLDLSTMMPVLLGMLGLGGLRTFEKHTSSNKRR